MYKSFLINYEQNNITDKSIKQTVNGISNSFNLSYWIGTIKSKFSMKSNILQRLFRIQNSSLLVGALRKEYFVSFFLNENFGLSLTDLGKEFQNLVPDLEKELSCVFNLDGLVYSLPLAAEQVSWE